MRQHGVDLVLALLRHELVRLVLGIINIADTVAEKINKGRYLLGLTTWNLLSFLHFCSDWAVSKSFNHFWTIVVRFS